ncbi:MAG TPA: site-specific DNA-methyltransferase [Anaerolineales bacterium]|jgi:site-specific DNA-methyltransferase (adenine-specific)
MAGKGGNSKRRGTETSAFGSRGRISHDASRFYDSRLYEGQPEPELDNPIGAQLPSALHNQLLCKSSEDMSELPDGSVHLMITSPPYNAQKEYDEDLTLGEYLDLLRRVFAETHRVLATGGRACINVANLGRKPYLPLNAFLSHIMMDIGFLMRGEIIWDKASSAGSSTAWGTWQSAVNPVLRDVHEYILVFSKQRYSRGRAEAPSTIGRDDFLEWTKSVWTFPSVSARKVGHPAPFPEELPRRLIELYSLAGDVVLDPFCGSGTTCLAAARTGRVYVGYDTVPEYLELARARLAEVENQQGTKE